jgi:multidrug resistance efflux pump
LPIEEHKLKALSNRSEHFQDILDKIPARILRWSNTLFLCLFLILVCGLRIIKYPESITSAALVTTERPPVEVYSRSSGRVVHLLKNDQDKTVKGEWIIVLNNSASYPDVRKTIGLLDKIDPNDFWNSINDLDLSFQPVLGSIQNTYFQFSRSVGELQLFYKLHAQMRQMDINQRREDNLLSLKDRLKNQLALQEKELAIAKVDLDRSTQLQTEGFVPKSDVEQKELVYLNLKSRVEELSAGIVNSQMQKELLEKENTVLTTDRDDSYFRLRNNVLQYYNALLFELAEWQNRYVLASPIDGTLNLYDIRSEDQFIAAEQKVFTVSPDVTQSFFALVKLPVSNSGKVHAGQKCIIRLHNYPYTEFGMLKGTLESISLAPKEGFYSAKVRLPAQLTTSMHKRLPSKSDLSGDAEIILEDLTLFDRLFNILTSKNQ